MSSTKKTSANPWTIEELRQVKEFKEKHVGQMTLDQMAASLSVQLERSIPTTRARLAQINKYVDLMENKLATPKLPIPDIFRTMAKEGTFSNTPVKSMDKMHYASIKPISPSPSSRTNISSSLSRSSSKMTDETPPDKRPNLSIPKFACINGKFTFSPSTDGNSNETTSTSIPQPICDKTMAITQESESPTHDSVVDIAIYENPLKRPRSSLYPPAQRTSIETQMNDQSTQTNFSHINLDGQQPTTQQISIGTQTGKISQAISNATIEEIIISDTEMEDESIKIIQPTPDRIIITKQDDDNTMRMARDYFGGKPFKGQQRITAEKFPSKDQLRKLATEDMKKAAYFIFDHKKNEEEKYCSDDQIRQFFKEAWNKSSPRQPSTFNIKHNYGSSSKAMKIDEHFTIKPTSSEKFKYLGVDILPNGHIQQITSTDLKEMINKVEKSGLSGRIKFKLMEKYGLPKLIFKMENSDQTRAELRRLNGQYRKFVRKIHGLRHDFPNDGLHLLPINGGYGATDIEERIARGKYNSSCKMIGDDTSKSFKTVVQKSKVPKIRADNAKYLKINKPEDEIDLRNFHQTKLLNRLTKSQRVNQSAKPFFKNKRANKWITNDRIPQKFKTDFMKIRYNIMPTRSSTHFFNGGKTKCRGCGAPSENVKHIISKCPANKGLITLRHNAVIQFLLNLGTRDRAAKTLQEKTFKTMDGLIKPDLIIISNNIARVFEVAVPYEADENTLETNFKEKLKKYEKHKAIIGNELQVHTVLFEPLILGAMGDVHDKSANSIVRYFKTTRFSIPDLSQLMLKKSRNMVYNITHMR
ncbi:hypothetical protein SNEBB_007785 [Seison nebaliae]|nr:hypothetical protein SNEBB_007785 [Seison nebaliae]